MSRGITSRCDAVSALVKRMESCSDEIDFWLKSPESKECHTMKSLALNALQQANSATEYVRRMAQYVKE